MMKKLWERRTSLIIIVLMSLTNISLVKDVTKNNQSISVASSNAKITSRGSQSSKFAMEYLNVRTKMTRRRICVQTVRGGSATREESRVRRTGPFRGGPPSAASTGTRAGPSASFPATASTASARD